MSLTVDVLAVEPVPLVRLEVGVPGAWEVTGSSEGRSWTVAKGAGPAWLSDPWAPLNAPVSYALTSAGSTYSAGPVTRAYAKDDLLTDLAGRGTVGFRWRDADDMTYAVRHSPFEVPGSRFMPYLSAPVAGAPAGALTVRTSGAGTVAMRELVAANGPVLLHHNHAVCGIPGCDIEPVRTVLLVRVSESRTGHVGVATRDWSVSWQAVPHPWGFVPPVALVSDIPARFPTVADLAGSGLTVADLAAGGWLVGS